MATPLGRSRGRADKSRGRGRFRGDSAGAKSQRSPGAGSTSRILDLPAPGSQSSHSSGRSVHSQSEDEQFSDAAEEFTQHSKDVTLHVSELQTEITSEDLNLYFTWCGDDSSVKVTMLGEGKAIVNISGLKNEEIQKIKRKKHSIKKHSIGVEIKHIQASVDSQQPTAVDTAQSTSSDGNDLSEPVVPDLIEVSGLPPQADEDVIMNYFQRAKSGGAKGAVTECKLMGSGVARIRFSSPEITANVFAKKDHAINRQSITLRQVGVDEEDPQMKDFSKKKLLVSSIPDSVDESYLEMALDPCMDDREFSAHMLPGGCAVLTFVEEQKHQDLSEIIIECEGVKCKGVHLMLQRCKVTTKLELTGITEHYEEEYIRMYFESTKHSGGGDIASIELVGGGEVQILFKDSTVVDRVLEKKHVTFGQMAILKRNDSLEIATTNTSTSSPASMKKVGSQMQPLILSVDSPLIAKAVKKSLDSLRESVRSWNVDLEVDIDKAVLVVSPTKCSKYGWKAACDKELSSSITSDFGEASVSIAPEARAQAEKELHSLQLESSLVTYFAEETGACLAAADKKTLDKLRQRVHEIEMTCVTVQEGMQLPEEDWKFISEVNQDKITKHHPQVKVTFNPLDLSLLLQGPRQHVIEAKRRIPDYAAHETVQVEIEPQIVQYLYKEGNSQLHQFLKGKERKYFAVFFQQVTAERICEGLVFLCSRSDSQVTRRTACELPKNVSAIDIALPDTLPLTKMEDYTELCQRLEKQNFMVHTSVNKVTVIGFRPGINLIIQELQQFIKVKRSITTTVSVTKEMWKLFGGPMRHKWDPIMKLAEQIKVEIRCPQEDNEEPTIVLIGDQASNDRVSQMINQLSQSVHCETLLVKRPGTIKYFCESNTKLMISGIQSSSGVIIQLLVKPREHDKEHEITTSAVQSFTKVCTVHTKEFKGITICVGDIAEFDMAAVIVNAANTRLKHIGGVAKAISRKGGEVIQEESDSHIFREGELFDGSVISTKKVGNLHCKCLIHAVGPLWQGGHNNEEAILKKACLRSFECAKVYHSIALPALSSGIYKFPIEKCAKVLIETAIEFSSTNSYDELQQIYFVLASHQVAEVFVSVLKKKLSSVHMFDGSSQPPQGKAAASRAPDYRSVTVSSANAPRSKKRKSKSGTKPTASSMVPTASKAPATTSSSTVHDRIQIKKGSLLDIQADAYVNTTNTSLNLSQGAVAKALSKAAGPQLQAECKKKAPVAVGSVTVTQAFDLQAGYIFHTVCVTYEPGGKAEKVLRELVQKCLEEASKLGLKSVAFPALGAGVHSFPSDIVAHVMIGETLSYLSANPQNHLVVYFIIFMDDTHAAFQKEHSKSVTFPSGAAALPNGASTSKTVKESKTKRKTQPSASMDKAFHIQCGVIVTVVKGDITEESTDAIVNPTNRVMKLAGPGVSGALSAKGGTELQAYCDMIIMSGKQLGECEVIRTLSAGNLKCKHILHIAFEHVTSKKIQQTLLACLNEAESCGCRSVAIPAIGTGTSALLSPHDSAKGMLRAIYEFSSTYPTHLHSIRLILYSSDVFDTFVVTFSKPDEALQSGFIRRFIDGISSYMPTLTPWPAYTSADTKAVPGDESATPDHTDNDLMDKELEITVYGEESKATKEVKVLLLKLIKDQFGTDTLTDPMVNELSHEEEQRLIQRARSMYVEIEIDRNPINVVRFKGDKNDIKSLKLAIKDVLIKCKEVVDRTKESKQLKKLIQWRRVDPDEGEVDYDTDTNYEIEQSLLREETVFFRRLEGSERIEIDLKRREETYYGDSSPVVSKVVRRDHQEEPKPYYWDAMYTDKKSAENARVLLVELSPGCTEYDEVKDSLDCTMQGKYSSIVKIQRVQNPVLYTQYTVKKKEVDKQNPPKIQNERLLFHGTSIDTCSKINELGFNRSFAGKNATVYGSGVYFARDASYSARGTYSQADSNGYKYMYRVRVLTGEFAKGDSSMIVPPPKDPKKPNLQYDSVVDNISDPQIFVVFYDACAYPEYLITFKCL